MSYKPVSSKVNLVEIEEAISAFWKEKKIFEKSVEFRPEDNSYTFVDGPPFVTGNPHYGSLLPSIAKDVIPRYQTMLGKRVRRVFGWDCHGLPIEEKVNKQFGIKSKTQLEEKMGIERYVQECRTYVENASNNWRWYIEKVGRWVDIDNAYYTMSPEFMQSVMWAFKQIWDKGLIYKGKRVSLFSTDTSTPVSGFEVAMDPDNYNDVEDLSIFTKFALKKDSPQQDPGQARMTTPPGRLAEALKDDRKVFLIAWTTTPWTIPANFALAVNPKFEYVLVEYDTELFIVAKDRVQYTFNKPLSEIGSAGDDEIHPLATFPGTALEGLSYQPIYDYFVSNKKDNDFKVYLSDDVTHDEGTGVLHIAPAFGEVDFQMGKKHDLSDIGDIDEEGKLTVEPWKGVYLRDASPLVAEDLQSKGNLLRSEVYTHRVPFYRGANPLIYMAQEAYFIDIQKIKQRMLELNEDTSWMPEHIKHGRFQYTLESSPDWCISRNRYWATIMPIWEAEDGDQIVVGSIEEMTQYTDQITKAPDSGSWTFEGKPMDLHRDVCDKIIFKKDGKEYHRIPEVLDCWMDSGSAPFAQYGYPFANKPEFERELPADFIIEYVGQVRAWFNVLMRLSTILFDQRAFTNVVCTGVLAGNDGRKMSKQYGNYPDPKLLLEKYGGDALRLYMMGSPVMRGEDMNFLEEGVQENYKFLLIFWNCYKFFTDYASIFEWSCEVEGGNGDKSLMTVLDRWILARLTQLVKETRAAFDSYDLPTATKLLKEFLINDFSTWYIRRSRDRVSNNEDIKDRNACLAVMYGVLVGYLKLIAPLTPFITEEMYRNLTDDESVHLTDYPKGDDSLLDPELVADMQVVRQIVEQGHAARKESNLKLRQPLAKVTYHYSKSLSKELEQIIAEELNVKDVVYTESKDTAPKVTLDTTITEDLKAEGEARELIRSIQQKRKEQNLTLNDKIEVIAPAWPKAFESMILKSTNADKITVGETLEIKLVVH